VPKADETKKPRWHRRQVEKLCPDCNVPMLADVSRQRCSSCAAKRQRHQSAQHAAKYKARPCRKCGKRLRSTDPESGCCRRCVTPNDCPDCGAPLDKSVAKKYFPCTRCTYVSTISEQLWSYKTYILDEWSGFGNPLKVHCTVCRERSWTSGASVTKGIHPCSYCSGAEISVREVQRVCRSAQILPLDVAMPRSGVPWPCVCLRCKRLIGVTWDNVKQGRGACVYCAKQRIQPDEAANVMRMVGLEPLVNYPGARRPWKCLCVSCGAGVTPRYDNIRAGQGGCSSCGTTGFRNSSPGLVYLCIEREGTYAKYGITNLDGTRDGLVRLRYLSSQGLRLSSAMQFASGADAKAVEQHLFGWIRQDLRLPFAVTREILPSGFSETFPMQGLSERQLRYRLTMTSRPLGGQQWRGLRVAQRSTQNALAVGID
jgi:hypothetical protein